MFEFLNKFTIEEMNKFSKFLISPYHNTNRNLIKLFKCLCANYPNISNQDISKKILFRKIFRTGAYDDVKMRKIISDFFKVTDKYLLQLEIENNELNNLLMISNSNLKRGMIQSYRRKSDLLQKSIVLREDYNEEQNFTNYNFLRDRARFNIGVLHINDFRNFENSIKSLDNYFILAKLSTVRDYYTFKYQDKAFIKPEFNFIGEILTHIENNLDKIRKQQPLIYIRYLALKMFENYDHEYFQEMINYFNKNKKKFYGDLLKEYCQNIATFYHVKINTDHKDVDVYQLEYFKMVEFLVKNKLNYIILYNDHITDQTYLSILLAALFVKEYEWGKSFIIEYKKYLYKDSQINTYNYAQVLYNFKLKNYDEMLHFLNKINFKIPYYFFHCKIFLILYHFEENNFVQLDYELINLKKYCDTNKEIGENEKKLGPTFLKYMQILKKCKSGDKKKDKLNLENLKLQLDKEKNFVISRYWFYKKINELTQ